MAAAADAAAVPWAADGIVLAATRARGRTLCAMAEAAAVRNRRMLPQEPLAGLSPRKPPWSPCPDGRGSALAALALIPKKLDLELFFKRNDSQRPNKKVTGIYSHRENLLDGLLLQGTELNTLSSFSYYEFSVFYLRFYHFLLFSKRPSV